MWDPHTGKSRGYGFVAFKDKTVSFMKKKSIKQTNNFLNSIKFIKYIIHRMQRRQSIK